MSTCQIEIVSFGQDMERPWLQDAVNIPDKPRATCMCQCVCSHCENDQAATRNRVDLGADA
jgi:hypothetical protein